MKSDEIIERYKQVYKEVKGVEVRIKKSGGWVYINDSLTAHRVKSLNEFADNLIEIKAKEKAKPQPQPPEELDIKDHLEMILEDGRMVFRSSNIKDSQLLGKSILKRAKRVLNMLEE